MFLTVEERLEDVASHEVEEEDDDPEAVENVLRHLTLALRVSRLKAIDQPVRVMCEETVE